MRFKDLAAAVARAVTGSVPDPQPLQALAEHEAKRAEWDARAEAAKARIRRKNGNANWQPRGEWELSIGLAPVAPGGKCGMHLQAGRHVVDGAAVEVPGERGAMVWVPMNGGRHIVDSKIQYAINPAAGIRVSAPRHDRPWESEL